jgi:plastocyanin
MSCSALSPDVGPLRTEGNGDAAADAAPDRSDAAPAGDGGPDVWTVHVGPNGNNRFVPDALTIRVGDTVHWVWDASNHTVTSGAGGTADDRFCSPSDTQCSSTPTSERGATYDHTFRERGTFPYFCRPHRMSGMTGVITVQ